MIFLDNINFRDLAIEIYRDTATGKKLSEKVAENSIKAGQGRLADKTGDEMHLSFVNDYLIKGKADFLRILTGKKHRQIKLQRLEKVRIWAFGLLVH